MKSFKISLSLFVAVTFISCFSAFAKETSSLKTLKILELEQLKSKLGSKLFLFDANTESIRTKIGLIPGAKPLSSASDYDLAQELPPAKNSMLVFYCANELCTASHSAAERAIAAGYTNVSVMTEGILGWQKAGKPLAAYTKGSVSSSNKTKTTNEGVISLPPKTVAALVKTKEAIIVDVREKIERDEVIADELWFPFSKTLENGEYSIFKNSLPKDKLIIIHCAAGVRAKKVATQMANEGFRTAFFEGPDQWRDEGLPLIKGPK